MVRLGWEERYCSQVGAMAQLYTAIPLKRESLRTSAGLHWKTRDRGGVASCGAHALHVTLVLAS